MHEKMHIAKYKNNLVNDKRITKQIIKNVRNELLMDGFRQTK